MRNPCGIFDKSLLSAEIGPLPFSLNVNSETSETKGCYVNLINSDQVHKTQTICTTFRVISWFIWTPVGPFPDWRCLPGYKLFEIDKYVTHTLQMIMMTTTMRWWWWWWEEHIMTMPGEGRVMWTRGILMANNKIWKNWPSFQMNGPKILSIWQNEPIRQGSESTSKFSNLRKFIGGLNALCL